MAFVQMGAVSAIEAFRAEIKQVTERSDGEKMALLMLRRGNDLAKACLAIGVKVGWPQPARRDWRALIACKLVTRDKKTGYLVLTPTGLMWQQRLAHAMARISGEHFLLPAGGDRFNVYCHCTCGWTASLSRNQGHLITGQWAAFTQHMDAVAKGVWKKPRSVEETIAGIFSPTVPAMPADASDIDAASEVYGDDDDIETSYDLLEEEIRLMAVKRGALEDFIQTAIELAANNGEAVKKLGANVRQVEVLENGDVHAYLDDGSRFYVEINHMVPRGYSG